MSDPSIDDGSNPEEAERRDSMITLRVTASERAQIEAASESAGRSVSEHLRKSAVDAGASTLVPELNREAWLELSRAVSNLNQIARQANRFGMAVREVGLSRDVLRAIVRLMRRTEDEAVELSAKVQALRRELYGAAVFEMAAEACLAWRKASSFGHLGVEAERLERLSEELFELSYLLEQQAERGGAS